MLKVLFFSLTLLLSLNASAVVKQSASKALSYRNIVDGNSRSKGMARRSHRGSITRNKTAAPILIEQKTEKVDMRFSDLMNVNLNKDDELEIFLSDDDGYRWKVSPSSSALTLVSDKIESGKRILKYRIVTSLHSYIYFDHVNNKTNKIEKTKQLNILPRN